jgi:S1-C subfamily serine protease
MENGSRVSGLSNQYLIGGLLVVFIAVSVVAMFTTSRLPRKLRGVGMSVVPLTAEQRAARGIPTSVGGVLVEGAEGIAGRAGVRGGDVIIAINGNRVLDMFDFSHFMGEVDISKRGTQIDLIRNGARMPVFIFPPAGTAVPTPTPTPAAATPAPAAGGTATPLSPAQQWLGIEAETVMAGDVKELGLPAGAQGVIVDTVTAGGRAEQAGLVNNDVIVAVNGQIVESAPRLWDSLARLNGAETVDLGVYRAGQLVSIRVPAAADTPDPAAAAPAGGFAGRMGGQGLGPGGILTCPKCATTVTHQRGVACFTVACPACGTTMVRTQ